MIDYEQQQALVEARQLHIAAPVILPIIEKLSTNAYQRLLASFRNGKTDNLSLVAELSVLEGIKQAIKSKLEVLNQTEEKR